jgi:hypothetical protein
MRLTNDSQIMAREPLTEKSGQGQLLQRRTAVQGSHKRAYGKGGTASSRAVLSDLYLDENEIEEQMSKISLGQATFSPLSKDDIKSVAIAAAVPGDQNGREAQRVSVSLPPAPKWASLGIPER